MCIIGPMPVLGHLTNKLLSTGALARWQQQTQRMQACRGWRRGEGRRDTWCSFASGQQAARPRWIPSSPPRSWPPRELASFPACDGRPHGVLFVALGRIIIVSIGGSGTKNEWVGACRGTCVCVRRTVALLQDCSRWISRLCCVSLGTRPPVHIWGQTVQMLDESMHPNSRCSLAFNFLRPLACFATLLAIGK